MKNSEYSQRSLYSRKCSRKNSTDLNAYRPAIANLETTFFSTVPDTLPNSSNLTYEQAGLDELKVHNEAWQSCLRRHSNGLESENEKPRSQSRKATVASLGNLSETIAAVSAAPLVTFSITCILANLKQNLISSSILNFSICYLKTTKCNEEKTPEDNALIALHQNNGFSR